jgi:hypothetical protein
MYDAAKQFVCRMQEHRGVEGRGQFGATVMWSTAAGTMTSSPPTSQMVIVDVPTADVAFEAAARDYALDVCHRTTTGRRGRLGWCARARDCRSP